MSFISYAQNYEDVMLWRALKHIKKGFYIDVGAAWPDNDSVTKSFYKVGWDGINIDPNPQFIMLLKEQRSRDINLMVAVSDYEGDAVIHIIDDTGLSTLSIDTAKSHELLGFKGSNLGVKVTTLAKICQEYIPVGQEIHFLKVDVEGFEGSVLRGNDWNKFRPWVLVVEATLPMSQVSSHIEWQSILIDNGYKFAYADGLNRFYVDTNHQELLEKFKFPPNIFDGFILNSQERIESKLYELEKQLQEVKSHEIEKQLQQSKSTLAEYVHKLSQASLELDFIKIELRRKEELIQQKSRAAEENIKLLQDVFASKSWRLTKPFRSISYQMRRIFTDGLTSRINVIIKKVLRKIDYVMLLQPTLRRQIIELSKKFGFYQALRHLYLNAHNHKIHVRPTFTHTYQESSNLDYLSPSAKKVFMNLKLAIERIKEKTN